jgi:two-component system NtrC family sensor kinase
LDEARCKADPIPRSEVDFPQESVDVRSAARVILEAITRDQVWSRPEACLPVDTSSVIVEGHDRAFGRLVDRSAQACVAADMEGRLQRVNRAFEELVGYKAEELADLQIADITPERWWAVGQEALARLRETGQAVRYEKEYRRKDGRIIPVEVAVDLDRGDDGIPRGYFAFITDIQGRKQAERALLESEDRFRRLYDEAPVGYHEIDVEGTIVSINRTECEMLGYSCEEMIGRSIFDFVAPENREQARIAVREKMEGTRPLRTVERPYQTKDGRRIIMAIDERYRRDDQGRIIGIRSALQDVTERKRTEAALVASEKRNRALFEGIEDAVFVHDLDGKILDANPAACRRLGYSREELLSLTTADVDDPEFASGYDERLRLQMERGHLSFEGRHRRKDGTIIPVDVNTSTILFENQRAVLAVIRDISERKALEETKRQFEEAQAEHARDIEEKNHELVRSEARYRQLAEGSLDAIVATDRRGLVTMFNPAAEQTFGYASSDVIGQPLTKLIPGGQDPREIGRTVERKGVRKTGELFPIEISLGAVDLCGELQFIGSIRDQTERQRMRAMLVQSEKLASIGLLSAGVAHEINNPLAYVGNNLAVLERDLKGVLAMMAEYESAGEVLATVAPEVLARIKAIGDDLDWPYVRQNFERMIARTRDGVQRVASIVQNLRGLARTSTPRLEPALVRDLIGPAVEMIQGRGRRNRIEIDVRIPPTMRIQCVSSQISQVVLNLLVNAMQAIESANRPGGGRIVISAVEGDDEIAISVRDDGCGIPAENVEKLFDPFFTTKVVGEGTGLGLSISHGIVTGHGGRIEVESDVGRGTTFTLVLPRRASHSYEQHQEEGPGAERRQRPEPETGKE